VQLTEGARFCSQCGHATPLAATTAGPLPPRPPLARDMQNKKIAGVCAGFARYFEMDITLMRVLWLVFAIFTGIGFVAYLVCWIVMPVQRLQLPAPAGEPVAQNG
jgi:phage shock protein C